MARAWRAIRLIPRNSKRSCGRKDLIVRVVNAGINGDTTEGMLGRLDRAVPNGTRAVILQPGGNDRRKGRPDRTADIQGRLSARGIPVIMLANGMLRGLPHQPDGQHLTPEGYHMPAPQSLAVAGIRPRSAVARLAAWRGANTASRHSLNSPTAAIRPYFLGNRCPLLVLDVRRNRCSA